MAHHPGTTARVQRLTSLAAIVLVALAVGLAFGRVFEGRSSSVRFVAVGLASGILAWCFERRSLLLATAVSGVGLLVCLSIVVFPDVAWYGLPSTETLRSMADAALQVGEQARLQVAPAPPIEPLLFASATAVWAAVFSCHALAFRAGSPLLALVPPGALIVFADSVLEELVRPMYGVLFLLAALAVLFADSLRRVQGWGPIWGGSGRRDVFLPAAGRGGRRLALAAVLVAVAAPLVVPGFGGRAVIDLSGFGGDEGIRLSTLVSMAGELTRGEEREVFQVEASHASYWRMTALDRFDGVEFTASAETPIELTSATPLGAPDAGTSITQTFRTSEEMLFPWVPAAYQATSIDLDGDAGWSPGSQTVTVDGGLKAGVTYTITSRYLEPSPEELRAVPYPASPDPQLTQLPSGMPPRIGDIALEWIRGEGPSMYDHVYAVQQHLKTEGFLYDSTVSPREDAGTLLEFLDITKRGFCQQFAVSMTVLLRSLGIPSRVAVGFTRGDPLVGGKGYVVTTENFHAWVEVYFEGYGWLSFDPTPLSGDTSREGNPTAVAYAGPRANVTCDPGSCPDEPTTEPTDQPPRPPRRENPGIDTPVPGGTPPRRTSLLWLAAGFAAVAVGAVLAWPFVRAVRRRRRIRAAGPEPARITLAIYDDMCRQARDLGMPRRLGETPREYADRLHASTPDADDRIDRLTDLAVRSAYGPRPLTPEDAMDAEADAGEILVAMRSLRTWRDRLSRRRSAA